MFIYDYIFVLNMKKIWDKCFFFGVHAKQLVWIWRIVSINLHRNINLVIGTEYELCSKVKKHCVAFAKFMLGMPFMFWNSQYQPWISIKHMWYTCTMFYTVCLPQYVVHVVTRRSVRTGRWSSRRMTVTTGCPRPVL